MSSTKITRGAPVLARDVTGRMLPKRALGEPVDGATFKVVWVCREEEWIEAERDGREPDAVPWPVEDVQLADSAAQPVAG